MKKRWIESVTLTGLNVILEPLSLEHLEGIQSLRGQVAQVGAARRRRSLGPIPRYGSGRDRRSWGFSGGRIRRRVDLSVLDLTFHDLSSFPGAAACSRVRQLLGPHLSTWP